MNIFTTIQQLQNHLSSIQEPKKIVGFVPTMGALHQGHISLLEAAKKECNILVCSIFVNPTQFNDPEDLKKYPRTFEADVALLEAAGCQVLFYPEITEMYTDKELEMKRLGLEDPSWKQGLPVDFGRLDKVMEGAQRPGHFNGVAQVVSKLFRIVQPDKAYFGLKDFQQLAVIRSMVNQLHLPVTIVSCPILREADGLAMSSRNVRLLPEERAVAPKIYQALQAAKEQFGKRSIAELLQLVSQQIAAEPKMQLDYFEISDTESLEPVREQAAGQHLVACIAVKLGAVRLIDNVVLC